MMLMCYTTKLKLWLITSNQCLWLFNWTFAERIWNFTQPCQKICTKNTSGKCWQIAFNIGHDLGITRLLHVSEICLMVLLSNAESKRVFLFLWICFPKRNKQHMKPLNHFYIMCSLIKTSACKDILKMKTCLWLSFLMVLYRKIRDIYKVTNIWKIKSS